MGVGRWVSSRGEPLEGRMAARCSPEGAGVPMTFCLMSLMISDMVGGLICSSGV